MHKLANKVMLEYLRDGGFLQGDLDAMMKVIPLSAIFQSIALKLA
jgi:hypothetical protein